MSSICFLQVHSSPGFPQTPVQSLPASPKFAPPPRPGVKPVASPSFNAAALSSTLHSRQSSTSLMQPLQPQGTGGFTKSGSSTPSLQQQIRPNYNIALPAISPISPPMASTIPAPPSFGGHFSPPPTSMSSPPLFAAQPAMGSLLAPSKPSQPSWNATKKSTNSDWGDFDPLA